ncbi:MAG: 2,4'-dihydroxyacetophenone dioxygenase family protein [Halieaceae bacterium]|nr:2,4'-dihydroxyacetophenone dioxygenase family protein [Halieaceae bacterium]
MTNHSTQAQLKNSGVSKVAVTPQHKSAFFKQKELEWTPWVMEGTWFKLLSINPVSGGFTMMLKVEPNNIAPVHGHIGLVEGIILEGGFAYEEDWGLAEDYVCEPAGINHKPVTGPEGMVMFAVVHGPLTGYQDDGSIAAVVDSQYMYQLAEQAGAAAHIEKPVHWQS